MTLSNQISIKFNDQIYLLNLNELLEKLSSQLNVNIYSIIRIKKEEFEQINSQDKLYTHFNLEQSGHIPNKIYLLLKIVQQGYYDGKEEILPILDFKHSLLYKCVECKEKVLYSSIKEDDFKYSMNHIKNTTELFQAIWRRYSISQPQLSKNEMYKKGVSITTLTKIETEEEIDNKLLSKIIEKLK